MAFRKNIVLGFFALLALYACGRTSEQSTTKTVDLPHTPVKWQSIGNCWVYAALGWVESNYLKANGSEINLSETYLTYRHFESQLLSRANRDEIQTGGHWAESKRLMLTYGLIHEGDFIPNESDKTFSKTQADALDYLNDSLKNGVLKSDRSPATVRKELDAAFGVVLAEVQSKIFSASSLSLGTRPDGTEINVENEIRGWHSLSWPVDWSNYPEESTLPSNRLGQQTASQKELLQRVMRALNDGHPVVMNWWVDFNGLDETGTFSLENVVAKGPGLQGYHSTVIEDYVVKGIHPQTGIPFAIGEGEATPEDKNLAAMFGEIEYFVIKNSWGGAERLNRSSYSRFGEKGYTKLTASYLFGFMRMQEDGVYKGPETGLNGFVLPRGY